MEPKNTKNLTPWRITIGVLAIGWIVYMWIKKDILSIYATMPSEQILPLIVTNVAVTVIKVISIAAVTLLVRWLAKKFKNPT